MDFMFFLNSALLGVGLAMDAFSVSLANGLNEPKMKKRKMCLVAGVFAIFQALMPMLGWVCVHTVVQYFQEFEKFIPWIALALLLFIGGKMLIEGLKCSDGVCEISKLTFWGLIVQGVATSIDALSVGFGQVCHFDSDTMTVPPERMPECLNKYLPGDVRVLEGWAGKEGFDATRTAKRKTYCLFPSPQTVTLPRQTRLSLTTQAMRSLLQAALPLQTVSSPAR